MTVQRADARRNYARILAVAEAEVAAHGGDASSNRSPASRASAPPPCAGDFPGRRAMLQAVFSERVEVLCARAAELADAADARAALLEWLGDLTTYSASARGMADALVQDGADDADHVNVCSAKLGGAVDPLLRNAAVGAVAPDVTVADLVTLVTGIALATEHHQDPVAEAHRLLGLTVHGLSPR